MATSPVGDRGRSVEGGKCMLQLNTLPFNLLKQTDADED